MLPFRHLLIAGTACLFATPAIADSAALELGAKATTQEARAVVRAGERVEIAASLAQRLSFAPHKPGTYVEAGTVLARFDCARMTAELAAREQAQRTLSLRAESEAELERFGATGRLDVRIAESERDQAAAEAEALRVALKECEVRAPFNARIAERHLPAHATPQSGQPIYTLIRAGDVELSVIVPAGLGSTLRSGGTFSFHPDNGDTAVAATITRLAPDIDPVSQTREIFARPQSARGLKPGMSGRAVFTP